jgi:hypothetical protein
MIWKGAIASGSALCYIEFQMSIAPDPSYPRKGALNYPGGFDHDV